MKEKQKRHMHIFYVISSFFDSSTAWHLSIYNLSSHWVLEIFLTIILSVAPIHIFYCVLQFYISTGSVHLVFYWAHYHCKESRDLGCCEVRKQWLYSVSSYYSCNHMPQYCIDYNCDKSTYWLCSTVSKSPAYCSTSWLHVVIPLADKYFH